MIQIEVNSQQKTFIVQEEQTQRAMVTKQSISYNTEVNLKSILEGLGLQISRCRFRIYNFSTNSYQEIQNQSQQCKDYYIPWNYLQKDVVLIKYMEIIRSQTAQRQSFSETSSAKKQRSRQRTISQVLEIVKQWRQIHKNTNFVAGNTGKKINLAQAADQLGISKKSLDDYFYQLRLGQKYGFNFMDHLDDKIGTLRNFIRENKPKGRKKDKNQKHPKKLKILQQLRQQGIQLPSIKSSSKHSKLQQQKNSSQSQYQYQKNNQIFSYQQQQQDRNPFNPFKNDGPLMTIQDKFYNQFQFMLNDSIDPFLGFSKSLQPQQLIDHTFMKKKQKNIINNTSTSQKMVEEKFNLEDQDQNNYFFD